ncbi:MAG TPA: two-component system response regulator [Planktothrix sp. UBA8407]|nr:two-component system response regulator [Planktothrix sp. UBA8402]HAO11820.1 two-component system response regulator [Planktothrix sp. UBA8407]HBK24869.1 two-component system response regulator [Planktothrix sp. UBA10369]
MAGRKILVIDDSKVIRVRVREMLPPGNFEVLEAKDGKEGLEFVQKEHPNLIMLDFLLPKLSGWDVFQRIQADETLRRIPLVLMSGRKEEVTEKISEPFQYFEFIEKPFEKNQLISAIKLAFQKANLPREPLPTSVSAGRSVAAATAPVAVAPVSGGDATDMAAIKAQMAKMQAEIDALKKQLLQLKKFIQAKLP